MASTRDIHDIMGMGGGPVQKPMNKKKKKVVEAQPRLSGISREVQALMGDSVPPVQIVEPPKYKSKPSLANKLYKPRHWQEIPFKPGARSDGLSLTHWKRALPSHRPLQLNGDVEMVDGIQPSLKPEYQFEEEFPMDKWAVAVRVPDYTDEQYERYFKVDDWTREETDYLVRLASEYDLRWMVIADRYDPQEIPSAQIGGEALEVAKNYSSRTMEQLKLRYYQVAAQDLELRTPKASMNPTEFALYEKMRSFDAKTETLRKAMAEKLFERTKDEAEEERTLLEELHRITKNEEEFIAMRRDLYARLEAAPSLRRNERGEEQNIVLSSAGLSELLSRLFAKEKHLKRRAPAPGDSNSTAQQQSADGRSRANTSLSRRDTMDTATEPSKKGSVSQQIVPKQLTQAEEERYGVSHPNERLTSGVSFRHEKINRVTTAKSQVQTQKINAALTELEIPARLSMPTEKVCKEFERLVSQIQLLLDARRTLARVSEEVKTLEEMRRQRLGLPPLAEQNASGEAMDVDKTAPAPGQVGRNSTTETLQSGSLGGQTVNGVDGGPGPAVDEDDEDAEGEDDVEASNLEKTQNDEEDEADNTGLNDDSMAQRDEGDEDENAEEEDEEDDDEDDVGVEDEDEDDDEGNAALMRGVDNDDGEDEGDHDVDDDDVEDEDEEEEAVPLHEEGDEEEEEEQQRERGFARHQTEDEATDADNDDDTQNVTMDDVEPEENDPDAEDDDEDVADNRPTSAGSRGHKRGASVISDASGAGSNRSGAGRKRRR
ncbi:swr complex subunit [Lithohypha guttulata]|nr:swr complex subunit [Lithohypha guttulata]